MVVHILTWQGEQMVVQVVNRDRIVPPASNEQASSEAPSLN
jgi:hypothetical protein